MGAKKKSFLWFRGFSTIFLLLANPYVMFESKKNPQILIAFLVGTKKVQLVAKKIFLWFRGFCTIFLLLTTPYVMFESKKKPSNSDSILSWHEKSTASRQKKFPMV